MDNMGNGVQMTYDLNRNNQAVDGGAGWGGSWFIWFFAIFILLAFINRGAYAAGYSGATPGMGMINNDFLYTNLSSSIDRGFNAVTNQNAGISRDLSNGFTNVANGLSSLGYAMKDCCCETNRNIDRVLFNTSEGLCGVNRNIDAVRYENKSNTADLSNMMQMLSMKNTAEMTAGFQKILDRMCADKEAALTARVNQLELGAAISAGNSRVIEAVRPFPTPSWIVGSPYESIYSGRACGPGFYPNR